MFWKQEDLTKWVEHINSIVGEDSLEGAYIAGEKQLLLKFARFKVIG